jgi:phage gpG-like protein
VTTITLKADVSGAQRWFKDFSADVQKAIGDAVNATALEVITDVKKRIQRGPKTGRTYIRASGKNLSREHTASAPGEAPATDSGDLASSIYFENSGKTDATIGSRLAYAAYLEFGTQRIDPRPSWTPAVELAQPKLDARVRRAIEGAAKK